MGVSFVPNKDRLLEHVAAFGGRRILVVGDVMLDRYVWGVAERISPEAPVPVVRVDREEATPGGAANVARNLVSMGARAHLAGAIGDDGAGAVLTESLRAEGIEDLMLTVEPGRPTTTKTRVIAGTQQVVRFDFEDARPMSEAARRALLEDIRARIGDYEAVIVSDYNKGVVSAALMNALRKAAAAKNIPIIVDPKVRNVPAYRGVALMTPNHHEAGEILGRRLPNRDEDIEAAGEKILRQLKLGCLIITRASLGMSIFQPGQKPAHIPTVARQVFDVTGAGDAVIAATTLARAAGATWEEAAAVANVAGGIIVGKIGTGTVTVKEMKNGIRKGF